MISCHSSRSTRERCRRSDGLSAVLEWIEEYLAAPDRGEYEPFRLYAEQADFVLSFFEINPHTGRRRFRRGVISRPRGWG